MNFRCPTNACLFPHLPRTAPRFAGSILVWHSLTSRPHQRPLDVSNIQSLFLEHFVFILVNFAVRRPVNVASNHITELSGKIAENSKIITDYLVARNLPAPSFNVDGLTELAISPADKKAFAARSNLIATTKELHDLILGPKESLRHLAWDVYMKSSILLSRRFANQAVN